MKDHPISVYQARYDTYIVTNYLYTATVKKIKNFINTSLPSDIIIIKVYASTSDEQVHKLTR